jgi:hypothetical protein
VLFDDRLFGLAEWLLGVAERVFRAVDGLLVSRALVPDFDGAEPPCEAAIAAPLPTVKATAAEAARSVRFGLRMDTSFRYGQRTDESRASSESGERALGRPCEFGAHRRTGAPTV